MCADCHSTNFEKNYDVESGKHHPTYSEMDVSCEACHGPGREHVAAPSAHNVVKVPEEALCTDCHDGVRDEGRYEHAAYLERVRH